MLITKSIYKFFLHNSKLSCKTISSKNKFILSNNILIQFRNISCSNNNSPSIFSTDTDSIKQLSYFPEFSLALKFQEEGKLSNALPLLQRVYDSIAAATGKGSILSLFISLKSSSILRYLGQYNKAIDILNLNEFKDINLIRALNMATTCHLLNCNVDDALNTSQESIQLFDKITNHKEKSELLSDSNCLLGLSFLFNNNFKDSEKYLQKSIITCNNSTSFLISMNNLGTLYFFDNQNEISVIKQLEMVRLNKFNNIYKNAIELERGEYNNKEIIITNNKELLIKAMFFWESALLCCTKDSFEFNFENLIFNNEAKDLIVELNNELLDQKLSNDDGSFTNSYVNILCNLSECHMILGDHLKSLDYSTFAVKILDKYKSIQKNSNNSKYNNQSQSLGRSLGLMSQIHMISLKQLTGEGLVGTALDHLNSPIYKNDIRNKLESSNNLLALGNLLLKWDKREKEGLNKINESNKILESIKVLTHNEPYLNSYVQFPNII